MLRILVVLLCFVTINWSQAQTVNCSAAATWASTEAYSGGAQVKYNGILYTANWWTQGNQPDINSGVSGSGKPWTTNGTCATTSKSTRTASITSASTGTVGSTIALTYTAVPAIAGGTWTVANGNGAASVSGNTLSLTTAGTVTLTLTIAETADYYAVTAIQNIVISAANTPVLDCSEIGIWDASMIYVGGDQVKYNSSLYQAKFWTQGNQPDISFGATGDKQWTLVGVCTTGGATTNMSWRLNGNNNANTSSYIGTINNTALKFKANNSEHMRLYTTGTLQLGALLTRTADPYFTLDVTGRVAFRSTEQGAAQTNILMLYSNNMTTPSYTAGYRHYTAFSHILLPSSTNSSTQQEVAVMNTIEYHPTLGARDKHMLIQNTSTGNLGVGQFTTVPEAKLHVKGTSLHEGLMTVKASVGGGFDAARFMNPTANAQGQFQYTYIANRTFSTGEKFGVLGVYEETPSSAATYSGQARSLIIQGQSSGQAYVGIGYHTIAPTEQLSVNGNTILTGTLKLSGDARFGGKLAVKEVFVTHNPLTDAFPDYVFDKNYKLKPLRDLEQFIQQNHHLPEIPSAKEVQDNGGISLGEMNNLMLKKIEELTLYIIDQNKRIEELEKKVNESK